MAKPQNDIDTSSMPPEEWQTLHDQLWKDFHKSVDWSSSLEEREHRANIISTIIKLEPFRPK